MQKNILFKLKGMQRDLSVSAFNPEYAYEAHNIRFMPTDESTLLSAINEKGNLYSYINNVGWGFAGTPIGTGVVDNNLVVFTSGDVILDNIEGVEKDVPDISMTPFDTRTIGYNRLDRIYRVWLDNNIAKGKLLFTGDLNFSTANPIETLSLYENEELKKIYWVDGVNQPRMINIESNNDTISRWNNDSFDFVKPARTVRVTVEPVKVSGEFPSGVVQYVITGYNKYDSESNILGTTEILYIAFEDRGGSPEEKISMGYSLNISNFPAQFKYCRVYRIMRTSLNGTPTADLIHDSFAGGSSFTITDAGGSLESVDPTNLLFVGGVRVSPYAISQKDNTLFLGNFNLVTRLLGDVSVTGLGTMKELCRRIATGVTTSDELTISAISIFSDTDFNFDSNIFYDYKPQTYGAPVRYNRKGFKRGEVYRLGFFGINKYGERSEVMWIGDKEETVAPSLQGNNLFIPGFQLTVGETVQSAMLEAGYTHLVPVVCYPELKDRNIIAQGIVSPTVYNIKDRYSGVNDFMSSWFFRFSDVPYDSPLVNMGLTPYQYLHNCGINNTVINITEDAWKNKASYMEPYTTEVNTSSTFGICSPTLYKLDASSACPDSFIGNKIGATNLVGLIGEDFIVDSSVVTFHSPDIENSEELYNADFSDLKFRIVGYTEAISDKVDIDFTVKNTGKWPDAYKLPPVNTYWNKSVPTVNDGPFIPATQALWIDEAYTKELADGKLLAFGIYPWQRTGSVNDCTTSEGEDKRTATLDKKKTSRIVFCNKFKYFGNGNQWIPPYGNKVGLFNYSENQILKLKREDLPKKELLYRGNVDSVYTMNSVDPDEGAVYTTDTSEATSWSGSDLAHGCFNKNNLTAIIHRNMDYPVAFVGPIDKDSKKIELTVSSIIGMKMEIKTGTAENPVYQRVYAKDPVQMKYKSTPHAVISFNPYWTGSVWQQVALPAGFKVPKRKIMTGLFTPFYNSTKQYVVNQYSMPNASFYQEPATSSLSLALIWIGELYRDNIQSSTRFGGTSEADVANNRWEVCGEPVELDSGYDISLTYRVGDTYFARYDCLKTYANSQDDMNTLVDITSTMIESRVNLDSRYDRNRGQSSNLNMSPQNFNLFNPVYQQRNNFFSYRTHDYSAINLNRFPNMVTWTKTKTLGEGIDTWTNITLASTLDMDGDKGPVRAIKRFNNELISFQDRGISNIMYNNVTQINSAEGVPIEIANSGKVNGKRYMTNELGCTNKWSICETPNGLYFIDDITKGIYLFNGEVANLSDKLGFHSWINSRSKEAAIWNPSDFKSFVTHYDKINGDVFFTSSNECLGFSEPLGQFMSFFNYENVPYMNTLGDTTLSIRKDFQYREEDVYKLWQQNKGEYNRYFNQYQPFSVTVIANPDEPLDKIFNTVEFRADSYRGSDDALISTRTFDTLTVWNEYQKGTANLQMISGRPSTIQKKFRIWRANIPRDDKNHRDRIRNPWAYIKLSMETANTNKTVLHDMNVYYFE